MNKKINLAVAGAVLLASATAANAGIIIPAGEWTMDINGNVNVFATASDFDDTAVAGGGLGLSGSKDGNGESNSQSINTGLLPAWLGFTGTTRQNDLDVSWTISFQPNVSNNHAHGDVLEPRNRQAFLTFGDKSWGTVKLGKDLGLFASDAILSDMTLLGVGAGAANSGAATTLGGIGTGYIYPAWKGQMGYTTPNMNGFQASLAITNPNQTSNSGAGNASYQDNFGVEGKASYSFAGPATGKVWASFAEYSVTTDAVTAVTATTATTTAVTAADAAGTVTILNGIAAVAGVAAYDYDVSVIDIGANVNFGNLGLTAYYYDGEGAGVTVLGLGGATATGAERDSDGGYLQATYVIPTGTKLGVAYGVSNLDRAAGDPTTLLESNERWTVGAYHPLTKHLNLVAEYNDVQSEDHASLKSESSHISLGAILFF